ncbi:MAG TPA: MBL fold metallo-hydrolase [Phycisphaerae bacterium]|nr:MBL fold metallo-hydrolase [Phycisphaerae bacterium]
MIAIALQSGSNGNCLYVESGSVKLLFDAGISGLQAQRRLEALGRDIRDVQAVILSHDHSDHVRCAGVFHRKFGLPVLATEKTLAAARRRAPLGELGDVASFRAGQTLRFGAVSVETLPTPHDGVDGVAFVVDSGRARLGILTDLGHVFDALGEAVASLDAAFLESNYDPRMLETGPYPLFLQQRIRGPGGHISNYESAELLARRASGRMKWACLAHLSEQNNEPALARQTHETILRGKLPLHVASRYHPTGPLEL